MRVLTAIQQTWRGCKHLAASANSYPPQQQHRAALSRSMASSQGGRTAGQVRLALCQMMVSSDKQANIDKALGFISEAAQKRANVVVLPEMWNCPYSNDSFPEYAEDIAQNKSKSVDALSRAAAQHGVVLIGGSIPERSGEHLFNTCCIFNPDGSLLAKHRKTHLFDINIPGKISFRESDTLTAGDALTCVKTQFANIGIGICYDLRFPEQAQIYRQRGADLIVFPGAFNMTTGPKHWELLQRARALDNQLYVCTCSPARDEDFSYVAWGHSLVAGPFGDVLDSLGAEEGLLCTDIDLNEVATRRTNMPLSEQRRHDLYSVEDKEAP